MCRNERGELTIRSWELKRLREDAIFHYLSHIQTVYIDPPKIPTAAAYTQTMQVLYNTSQVQTVVVRTQSACMLTEPEPEVETAELMMQTEAEEPTPVATVDTQTISVKLSDSIVQTERKPLSHIHTQTDKAKMNDSFVQTDDVSTTHSPLTICFQSASWRLIDFR